MAWSQCSIFVVTAAASICLAQGCAQVTQSRQSEVRVKAEPVRVEMLYFEGCPTTETMRARLLDAIRNAGDGFVFVEVDLESLALDDVRRGYGSPTVLIHGHDMLGMPNPEATELSCRLYPEGVPSSVELAELIETQVQQAQPGEGG